MDGLSTSPPQIRVRFAETDAQGVAHNSNYLVWFEVARVEFLERFAGGYQRLRDEGIESLVARGARALHRARPCSTTGCSSTPAASTCAARASGSSTRSSATATVIADGWTAHGTVDAQTLRPTRTPEWLAPLLRAARPIGGRRSSS